MTFTTRITLAALLATTAAVPALAVVPLTTTITNDNSNTTTVLKTATRATASGTVTVESGKIQQPNGSIVSGGPAAGTDVAITKFDTTTGILVGARVNVAGVNTGVNTRVNATVTSSGAGRSATAVSENWKGTVSGIGFQSITNANPVASSTRVCAPSGTACTTNPSLFTTGTTSVLSGNRTIDPTALESYAANGPENVSLQRTADGTTKITTTARTTNATAGSAFAFTGGVYQLAYDYLLWSTPSFDPDSLIPELTLDFGTRQQNGGPYTLSFTLYNVATTLAPQNVNPDSVTAGASLTSIQRELNTAAFGSNVAVFQNLLSSGSTTFNVTFNPTSRGSFSEVFTFNFIDYAKRTGTNLDGIGLRTSALTLNVLGSTIPEPQTWAMLVAGFALVGFSARRRRITVAA